MKKNLKTSVVFLLLTFPVIVFGQSQKPYSLFNPVPKSQMREMQTDRPDVTETPYTVDAGHIQIETDLFRLEKEKGEISNRNTYYFNQGNIKIGLLNSTSIQFGFQSYVVETRKELTSGDVDKTKGIGDINIRIKQNIIGNDGGNFALAILPFVKFPTATYTEDSRYEGGVIIPMHYKLSDQWDLGSEIEADRKKDDDVNLMHTEILQSLSVTHGLSKHVDAIGETYYRYDVKKHHWSNYLNASTQIELSKRLKIDAGINYGMQSDAEKNYFIGTSIRL
ncbi:transporter [Pedobacter sp. MC2016-15]|uniref:transporter n=1 Tax=Pedobacter sp. MC2016-15 TaxID=2994473 RepID=UPI002246CEBE|nr:transporter [Pedobacter sp. MC2016-15]MCX2481620.1 transporter [Pedobacter sp. MC2016-15]